MIRREEPFRDALTSLRSEIVSWGRAHWGSEFDRRLPFVCNADQPMFARTGRSTFHLLYDRGVAAELHWRELKKIGSSKAQFERTLRSLKSQIDSVLTPLQERVG